MIDAYSSEEQYLAHLLPIWNALDSSLRGEFYMPHRLGHQHPDVAGRSRPNLRSLDPVIVASYSDYRLTGRRPVVFVEHGAGQAYGPQPARYAASYSGGPDRDRVKLFICPNPTVADRNFVAYPDATAVVVGCPRMDVHYPAQPKPISDPPVAAFAWHADLRLAPETASAFRDFHTAIPMVKQAGYRVLGHGHPRILRRLVPFYRRYGVEVVTDREVFQQADVLVVDNSSIAFEYASLGRPVVWMSPSFYRREFHAFPRFWDALVLGEEATTPAEVVPAIARALEPVSPAVRKIRDEFIASIYTHRDSKASWRAARAIEEMLGGAERARL